MIKWLQLIIFCICRSHAFVAVPPACCVDAAPVEITPQWPVSSMLSSCCSEWGLPVLCWCLVWRRSLRRYVGFCSSVACKITCLTTNWFSINELHHFVALSVCLSPHLSLSLSLSLSLFLFHSHTHTHTTLLKNNNDRYQMTPTDQANLGGFNNWLKHTH